MIGDTCPICHGTCILAAVANPDNPRAKSGKRQLWYCPACDTTHFGDHVTKREPFDGVDGKSRAAGDVE